MQKLDSRGKFKNRGGATKKYQIECRRWEAFESEFLEVEEVHLVVRMKTGFKKTLVSIFLFENSLLSVMSMDNSFSWVICNSALFS